MPKQRISHLAFEIKLEDFGPGKDQRITIFDAVPEAEGLLTGFLREVGNSSKQTAKTYYYFLRGFLYFMTLRSLTLRDITHDDCQAYIDFYKSKNADRDKKGKVVREPDPIPMFAAVRRLMKWYLAHKTIEADPTALITIKPGSQEYGKTKPITMDQVKSMLDCFGKLEELNMQASRDMCLIAMLTYTGLRITAALSCRVSDLSSLEDGYGALTVLEKARKHRVVPVIPECMDYLASHIEHCMLSGDDYIFQRVYKGGRLSGYAISRNATRTMLIARAKDANIDTKKHRITNHTFRSTFATTYLRAGADINQAKRMMGHKSANTTAKYDHRDMMELARDISIKMIRVPDVN